MKNVQVSFVIPVYNAEEFLPKCINSILNQSYKDVEIICVNDGSNDRSLKVIEDFAAKNDNIKVINQENKGIAAARNKGMQSASGKYVWFVDADDWIKEGSLIQIYEKAEKDNLDIVCFNVANYDNKTGDILENQFFPPNYFPMDWERAVYTYKNYKNMFWGNFSVVNKLYNREFLQKNNMKFIENLKFEDHPFHLKTFLLAEKIGVINESLYFYRKNTKKSFMNKIESDKRIFDMFDVMTENKNILQELDKYDEFRTRYLEYMVLMFVEMFMNSTSMFIKPGFFKRMKKYFKEVESNQDDLKAIWLSKQSLVFIEVLSSNWLIFLLKYRLLSFGLKSVSYLKRFDN